MTLTSILAFLGVVFQLLTAASQPGVTETQKQQALAVAQSAITISIASLAQNTPPTPTSTPDPTPGMGGGSGTGSGQATTTPVMPPVVTSTPVALQEVDMSSLARISWGRFDYNTSTRAQFDVESGNNESGQFRSTNSITNAYITMNGQTISLTPVVRNSNELAIFNGLTPDTDYDYSARVEANGKFAVTSGTIHTGR